MSARVLLNLLMRVAGAVSIDGWLSRCVVEFTRIFPTTQKLFSLAARCLIIRLPVFFPKVAPPRPFFER
jgi:hypothetical protein